MKMKKSAVVILILGFFSLFVTAISSQQEVADTSRIDPRFDLRNITFFKNITSQKKGQELNAVFELHNNTEDQINLKVSAVAFHERDLTSGLRRKNVEYPKWRKRDLDTEVLFIDRYDAIPDVAKADVEGSDQYGESHFVPFHHYVNHVESKGNGIDVKLRGVDSPRVEDIIEDNVFVFHDPLKTTVNFKLRTRYTEQSIFFNYFGLVITDADSGKVVYTQLYYFDKPFRIR